MSDYNLGIAVGKIIIDGSRAKDGFGVATVAANAFYDVVQKKLDSVRTLGDNLTKMGAAGGAGLGVAIHAASNFETSLSGVKAVSGATTAEMEKLRSTALRIGKDTSFSATEAANALQELVKAGVSTKDILGGAADATVALAAAGEIDLPRAAEIASSAINNFGLSGKQLPHVADLIAGAANASAIDVGDFGFSLSQAGAVANLTGLKFDDLAVAIAEMGQAGIKGSDAGTSIKTFLTNLIPVTDKEKNLFEELGLITVKTGADFSKLTKAGLKPASSSMDDVTKSLEAYVAKTGGAKLGTVENAKSAQELGIQMGIVGNAFFDAQGKMLPFRDIQATLQKATKDMTKEQKLMTLNTLFGSDAIRASAVFAEQGAVGFDKMSTAIGKVSAADVAATRLDNLGGSVEQLKGSFETMQIIIGEVFLPLVKKVVDGATSLVNVFNNLPEPVQKTIAIMIGLGSAFSLATGLAIKLLFVLGPMLARFLGFRALGSIFSIFKVGFTALREGAGIMGSLSLAFGRAGVIFTRFQRIGSILFSVLSRFPALLSVLRTAATFAFGPWGIAIAVVAGALFALYKNFAPFHDLVDSLARTIRDNFLVALDGIRIAWANVVMGFQSGTAGGGILGFFQKIGVAAGIVTGLVKDLANTFMTSVVPALQAAGGTVLVALKQAWDQLAQTFITNVLPALKELGAAFVQMLPALQQLWVALEPILKVLGIIALVIIGSVVVAVYALLKVIILLLPYLIQLAAFMISNLVPVFTAVIQVLLAVIQAALAFAKGFVDAIRGAVEGVAQMLNGLVTVVRGVFNLIKALVTGDWAGAWTAAKQIFQGFKDIIVGLFTTMASLVVNIIKGLVNGIIAFFKGLYDTLVGHSIVPDMINAIVAWFASLPGKAFSALSNLGSNVVAQVKYAMALMKNAIQNGIDTVINVMANLPYQIYNAMGNLGGLLRGAGAAIMNGLVDGIRGSIGYVKSWLNYVTSLIPSWKGPPKKDAKLLNANGRLIMDGLIDGLNDRAGDLKSNLMKVTDTIAKTMNDAPMDLSGTFNSMPVGPKAAKLQDAIVKSTNPSTQPAGNSNDPRFDGNGNTPNDVTVNNTYNIYNPTVEPDSVSITKAATRRANLGVLV